jgi:polysaccharide biosynthesis protein PslJ
VIAAPRATSARPLLFASVILASLGILSGAVVLDHSVQLAVLAVGLATVTAVAGLETIGWTRLIVGLILVILFIPIRRYSLPANLPFQLEPYRLFVALLVLGWTASLLVDPRTKFRRTGLEAPIALIIIGMLSSIVANAGRVANVSETVNKSLMFFLSFLLVLWLIASVVRRLDEVELLVKTLVLAGAVVAVFAVIEARTGFNVFNHLSRVIPVLNGGAIEGPEFIRFGTGKLRVFGSAEHPIALSAALAMLVPLAIYLARRYDQRRWAACAIALVVACASTLSRTGIVMLVVMGVVFLWLRPRETRRLWPAILPALIVVHFALPGTLGSIKHSFMPAGGLVAEQQSQAGQSGSGRLADLGSGLQEWKLQALFGQGYATRVVDSSSTVAQNNIVDNQWLGTLLEVGAIGFVGWLWFFGRAIRRFGREAKRDYSDRGWLLVSITAAVAAFAVGMFTYDAFSFIQVTFLMFILVALGTALLAERPTPRPVSIPRDAF